ncbi:MAG: iron ABC transporter permease, partial [Clostridia bacterium]|nr:iron ABC transporter permease [Clostridia bacterium]
ASFGAALAIVLNLGGAGVTLFAFASSLACVGLVIFVGGRAKSKRVIGLVPLFALRWRINILTLGDEEARTMGVNAPRLRVLVILCATLVTAAAVSVSGVIGWVGLVIPHLARRMVGNNYRHLMPASMLFGALFLLLVDDIARNAMTTEIPIGILTSFIGAPFFIYLITRDGERI